MLVIPFPIVLGQVHLATTYEQICKDLDRSFSAQAGDLQNAVRLVGLIFARPATALAKEDVLPNLSYLHQRSKDFVYFYCGGYWKGDLPPDAETGRVPLGNGWMYSDAAFDNFREQIESLTTWHYSGGADLILTNARYEVPNPKWEWLSSRETPYSYLDFTSVIAVNLEEVKRDASLPSVFTIFEGICRYAERSNGQDPTWGFSDQLGGRLAGEAFKEVLVFALPEALRDRTRQAFQFAAKDISRQPSENPGLFGWRRAWTWLRRLT